MNIQSSFKTRSFRVGGYSLLLTAAVLAIAILINSLLSLLPASVIKPSISPYDYYSLTDLTKNLVSDIEDKITLNYVVTPGGEDEIFVEFARRYCELNDELTLKFVDPSASPSFVEKYTEAAGGSLTENSIVVVNESTGTARVVVYENVYGRTFASQEEYYYYMMGYDVGTKYFAGETEMTSALDYVTMAFHPTILTTSGHGETALGTIATALKADNYDVESLNLLTSDKLDPENTLVLINTPTKDFSEDEITVLRDYMKEGGKVMLFSSFGAGDLPRLYALMNEYGMGYTNGYIEEGNVNQYYSAPYILIPTVTGSAIANKLTSTNITLLVPLAHPIDTSITLDASKFTMTVLLNTSNAATFVPPEEDEEGEEDEETGESESVSPNESADAAQAQSAESTTETVGSETTGGGETDPEAPKPPFAVGAMVESTDGGTAVWFSSPYFIDDQFFEYNYEYVIATFQYLTGKESSISIATKSLQDTNLVVSNGAQTFWAVALIGIIPVGTIVMGFFVWNKRRKQ